MRAGAFSLWYRAVSEGVVGKVNPPIGKLQIKATQSPLSRGQSTLGLWVFGRGEKYLGAPAEGPALEPCTGEEGRAVSLPHLSSRWYRKGKNNFVSLWGFQK